MELRTPDYYPAFRCLVEDCPHTCCAGWEVEIDEITAARYRTMPGELGEDLRRWLRQEDGADYFALTEEGNCPFLDSDGLCRIHRRLGAEYTGEVCRSHPRFTEDYGVLRETSLCASCPEACRLLLAEQAPLTFPVTQTEEAGETPNPWLSPLLSCRERALSILQDRTHSLGNRLAELLAFSETAQGLLDQDAAELLPRLAETWRRPLLERPAGPGLFPEALSVLEKLEILGEDWRELLHRAKREAPGRAKAPDWALERICAYFLFRYFLKTVNDGDLLSRTELAVFSVLLLHRLSGQEPLPEALRMWSREVEHCQENLAALQAAFCSDPRLAAARLLTACLDM